MMKPGRGWFLAAVVVAVAAVAAVAFVVVRSKGGEPKVLPTTPPIERPHHMAPPVKRSGARSPSPASPGASAKPRPRGKIVIHGAGDTNVDPNYVTTFRTQGYDYALSGMNGLFERDDLTVINLECPASNKGKIIPKEFNFRCDPKALPVLFKDGVDVANQGNNHAYDFGPDALVDSLKNIKKAGIAPVGAGRDDEEANEAAYFQIKGWKIAVVGWGSVVDPYPVAIAGPNHPGVAAGHDFHEILGSVKTAARDSDIVIVTVHWGVELDTQPQAYQVVQGHKLIKAGADIIFGHHAHRLQPLDMYKGRPIFWGLGNFVWPAFSSEGAATGVAEVTVYPNGRFKAKLLPARIEGDGHPVLTHG